MATPPFENNFSGILPIESIGVARSYYGAEAWTYRKEEWKRWLAFETTCYANTLGGKAD